MFSIHRGSRRTRPGLALAALATLGLVTAACSSGGGGTSVSLGASTTAAPATASTGAAAAAPGSSGGSAGGAPGTTPAAPASPTTGATSAPAASRRSNSSAAPAAPAAAAPKVVTPVRTGPAPAAAGTYSYTSVGSSTITAGKTSTTAPMPSVTTLVVSSTDSSSTLQWNPSGTSENLAFNGAGVFLTSETVPLVGTTCTFAAPVASPPWPPAAGQTFSGQATCGQGSSPFDLPGSSPSLSTPRC